MAKGLKKDDKVALLNAFEVDKDSEAFKQGLEHLEKGEMGKVVEDVPGERKVIVDFDGKQVIISNQRLEKLGSARRGRPKRENPPRAISPAQKAAQAAPSDHLTFVEYTNPAFVTEVANTLLTRGGLLAEENAVVLEIKLTDLPVAVQQEIRALMEAKLKLGPQNALKAKRGRKPKKG